MNTGKTDNPGSREDEFADLLKGAGRGPRLSEQARERIRGDVEAHWRAVMDQRSQPQAPGAPRPRHFRRGAARIGGHNAARRSGRRRRWPVAVAAAGAALLAVIVLQQRNAPGPGAGIAFAQIAAVEGPVSITRDGELIAVGAGATLEVLRGDRVVTSAAGRVALRLSGASELRLNTDTIVEVVEPQAVRLVAGMVYFDAPPAAQRTDFRVRTDFGVVAHVGTQYAAGIDVAGLFVRVREGEAAVSEIDRAASAATVVAGRGEQLQVDAAGGVTRSEFATDHPDWAWAQALARAPFDGPQSVSAVLEWAARATGREVRFESAAAEAAARTAMLNQVDGLSPDEVLSVINSTTNLAVAQTAAALDVTSSGESP